jgi:hypothetical protein
MNKIKSKHSQDKPEIDNEPKTVTFKENGCISEYNKNGFLVYQKNKEGYWHKREYKEDGFTLKRIEDSDGYWVEFLDNFETKKSEWKDSDGKFGQVNFDSVENYCWSCVRDCEIDVKDKFKEFIKNNSTNIPEPSIWFVNDLQKLLKKYDVELSVELNMLSRGDADIIATSGDKELNIKMPYRINKNTKLSEFDNNENSN